VARAFSPLESDSYAVIDVENPMETAGVPAMLMGINAAPPRLGQLCILGRT
jgi:hypothetical protein